MKGICVGLFFALVCATAIFQQRQQRQQRQKGFNWAIQGQDDAIAGCPHRYKEWVSLPNGGQVLIGCWGDATHL
ncbi:MAG TPA: hypothetical protein VMS08_01855 [Candidatus Saccharimonadia bacterium]|nr:hypothetical protein [Candidatus Saccharimonadia bacterium]